MIFQFNINIYCNVYKYIYNVSQNLFDLSLSEKDLKLKTEDLASKIEDLAIKTEDLNELNIALARANQQLELKHQSEMLLIRHYLSQTVSLHKSTKRLQRLIKDLH